MWLKRLTNSLSRYSNKEELENDLKKISIIKIITLFITLQYNIYRVSICYNKILYQLNE